MRIFPSSRLFVAYDGNCPLGDESLFDLVCAVGALPVHSFASGSIIVLYSFILFFLDIALFDASSGSPFSPFRGSITCLWLHNTCWFHPPSRRPGLGSVFFNALDPKISSSFFCKALPLTDTGLQSKSLQVSFRYVPLRR